MPLCTQFCTTCNRPCLPDATGLCFSCFQRKQQTSAKRPGAKRPRCVHCKLYAQHKRGMCMRCYLDRDIRALYPPTSKFAPIGEPTMAELEAQIAERSRPENLPKWWEKGRGG